MKCYSVLVVLLTAFALNGSAQMQQADVSKINNKFQDIAYATVSNAQKLDVYLPDNVDSALPVIMSVHGGAFMFGDKADGQLTPMLQAFKYGYAVVSINYRLSGESQFPAQIQDVKAAIRWIKANAEKYHFDASKIALWGGSAGGNLVSLAGTSAGIKGLEDLTLGNAQFSSNVQAVVDWFGPTDFLKMDEQFKASGNGKPNHSAANSPESKLMGKQITEIPELVKKANPETYISKNTPPFLMQHGTKDNTVPTQQSENFYQKLIAAGQQARLVLLEGAGHGGPQFESDANLAIVLGFLDEYLK